MVKYEWKSILSEVRLKKKYRTIKRGPKKLNFGASKPGVRGGPRPLGPPLDPLVNVESKCPNFEFVARRWRNYTCGKNSPLGKRNWSHFWWWLTDCLLMTINSFLCHSPDIWSRYFGCYSSTCGFSVTHKICSLHSIYPNQDPQARQAALLISVN